jgi:hypothetical protein
MEIRTTRRRRMPRPGLWLALLLAAVLPAFGLVAGCKSITGSGETVTWVMDRADFAKLDIGSGFDVNITRADAFLVRITIDKALNEYLSIDQRGDTLRIGLEANNVYTNTEQKAVITLPDLRRLELSGASKASVSGFSTGRSVDYELSGGSRLKLVGMRSGDTGLKLSGESEASGDIKMDKGKLDLSGGSRLELDGSATDIDISGSDESEIALADFPVTNASISLSGASRATVRLTGRMDLDLSDASAVDYIGNPKLGDINMSGGSTVNHIQ